MDRRPWTDVVSFIKEDDSIKELVEEYGVKRWTLIAKMLVERYNIRDR